MPSLSLIALVALFAFSPQGVFAGHLRRSNGRSIQDSFIVVLKQTANATAHIEQVSNTFSISDTGNSIKVKNQFRRALNGYSATLKGSALQKVLSDPEVDYVAEDSIATTFVGSPARPAMIDAFGRRSTTATNGTDGSGVDIYGIDTGIFLGHDDFGGRAKWGATFGGYNNTDDNGHGTHTASIAAGAQWGVAKAANLVAVKVLGPDGNGAMSDIAAGVEWVMSAASSSGRPSVVNMSLGGPRNEAVDQAVQNAVKAGIHFAVAAGNDGVDADGTSPARVPEANTVGAADRSNKSASFSNIGPDLDVYGLGVEVTAAWNTGPSATMVLSGTSMASPQIAGFLAVALSKAGKATTPAALSDSLVTNAQAVVSGQPNNTTDLLAEKFS